MGITKAGILSQYVRETGKVVPQELIEQAIDPETKIEQFKAEVFSAAHIEQEPVGKWRDLKGFFATDEDWSVIQRACVVAMHIDPVIPKTIPEWSQRKEILMRWAQEFLSAYEAEVGGVA